MAKAPKQVVLVRIKNHKKTSQDTRNPKLASMNKRKKASFKKYRGQGR